MFGWFGFVSGVGLVCLFGWFYRLWDAWFYRFICGDWGVWDSREPTHGIGPVWETWEGVKGEAVGREVVVGNGVGEGVSVEAGEEEGGGEGEHQESISFLFVILLSHILITICYLYEWFDAYLMYVKYLLF